MSDTTQFKPVVLIVDDEPLLVMNATELLEDAGFAILVANNAENALAQIADHPEIAILFTDINMPGQLDGLELARLVHEGRPDIQIVLTSGRPAPANADLPDDGSFISKPYDCASLVRLFGAGRRSYGKAGLESVPAAPDGALER